MSWDQSAGNGKQFARTLSAREPSRPQAVGPLVPTAWPGLRL